MYIIDMVGERRVTVTALVLLSLTLELELELSIECDDDDDDIAVDAGERRAWPSRRRCCALRASMRLHLSMWMSR